MSGERVHAQGVRSGADAVREKEGAMYGASEFRRRYRDRMYAGVPWATAGVVCVLAAMLGTHAVLSWVDEVIAWAWPSVRTAAMFGYMVVFWIVPSFSFLWLTARAQARVAAPCGACGRDGLVCFERTLATRCCHNCHVQMVAGAPRSMAVYSRFVHVRSRTVVRRFVYFLLGCAVIWLWWAPPLGLQPAMLAMGISGWSAIRYGGVSARRQALVAIAVLGLVVAVVFN